MICILQSGKDVLLETPAVLSIEDGNEILNAIEETNLWSVKTFLYL